MNETIPYLPGMPPVGGKELCARFDGGRLSSDGGVLLLAGIERRLGIAELAVGNGRCIESTRAALETLANLRGRILGSIAHVTEGRGGPQGT